MVVIIYYYVGCEYRITTWYSSQEKPFRWNKVCTGCNYETCNYETTPRYFYLGSPMAVTLGQHYNVGEKDTTLGQQYGVGEKDARKAKTEAIVPHQA